VTVVSYNNILSVVLAALRIVYGIEKIQQNLSSYYLGDEIRGNYRGMMITIFCYNLASSARSPSPMLYFSLKKYPQISVG
jgi:hypothetical protein